MILAAVAAVSGLTAVGVAALYAAWLRRSAPPPVREEGPDAPLPPVLVVVPVYNEAPLIERKLENLLELRYPRERLRVVIVDGGSKDGTQQRAAQWIAGRSGFAVLCTTRRDKTAQINDALIGESFGEWILVTDADASLPADVVVRLVEMVRRDPGIGVVGVRVRPVAAHALESMHWRVTDWLREREHDRGSAAIVAAPCYLARRALLAGLPSDVVADDVHVACRAMLAGQRVGHADCTVIELRSPRTIVALLRHKFRKADAYLREIVRFLPHATQMPRPVRAIFLWRATLLTIVPLLGVISAILGAIAVVRHAATFPPGAGWGVVFVLFRPVRRAVQMIALATILGFVSTAALLVHPFSRQRASFPKIAQPWQVELPDETS